MSNFLYPQTILFYKFTLAKIQSNYQLYTSITPHLYHLPPPPFYLYPNQSKSRLPVYETTTNKYTIELEILQKTTPKSAELVYITRYRQWDQTYTKIPFSIPHLQQISAFPSVPRNWPFTWILARTSHWIFYKSWSSVFLADDHAEAHSCFSLNCILLIPWPVYKDKPTKSTKSIFHFPFIAQL